MDAAGNYRTYCCSVLQCVAVCCSVLQYVAVCNAARSSQYEEDGNTAEEGNCRTPPAIRDN